MARSTVEDSKMVPADLAEGNLIRILHVDDETDLLKVAKRSLEMEGNFLVDSVSSVEEATRKLKKKKFDVIVSDYRMPGKDGLRFLQELRQEGNNTPFIIFTGKGREEVAITALNFGADWYISKSGNPETVYPELAHSIQQAVERKRTEQKLRESEENYRNLFELAPDAIVTLDMKGFVTSCNAQTLMKTGYSRNEITGKHFSKLGFLRPKEVPRYLRLFSSISSGKLPEPFEAIWHHKDGTPFVSEFHAGLIKKDGKTVGFQVIARDITKRKKTEEILHESEERFRSIVENSHSGIAIVDDNFQVLYVNSEVERIVRRPKTEILGQDFRRFLDRESRPLAQDLYVRRQNGEEVPSQYYFKITREDGEKRDVEIKSTIMRNIQGRIQTIAQVLDVTEQKKTEDKLRREKEQFETLFNLMADPVVIVDSKGKFLAISDRVSRITGYEKEELVGKNFMRIPIVTAKSKAILVKNLAKRMMEKQIAPYEIEVVRKDGRKLPFEINAAKIEYEDRPADLVVFRNLEERKKAEKMIRENQEKFERLFKDNPEAAVYVDGGFHILDVNPKFTELFGHSLFEVKGQTLLDIIVPEDKVKEAKELDQGAKSGHVYCSDTVRKRRDGTRVPVSISAAPIKVEGQLLGYVGLYKDISELKTTEKAVQETMIKLATMNEKLRVVGRLTRHDVRNKLATVRGNVFLARKRLPRNHEASEYLKQVDSAVHQVEEIFDFAGSYEMLGIEELSYLEVEKSFQEAVQLFPHLQDVEVLSDCRGVMVLADSLLRRLFYNLIDNSLRHGENVRAIKVHFEESDEDELELIYEDDGVGIPKSKKEKIFMEGYGKGTGYGLYLITKICEVYGWEIRETGKHGKGVRFTMTIPEVNEEGRTLYKHKSPTLLKPSQPFLTSKEGS